MTALDLRASAVTASDAPRLYCATEPLTDSQLQALGVGQPADLLNLLAHDPDLTCWMRRDSGVHLGSSPVLVGTGRVLTLRAGGADRIEELRRAWRATVYASWWRDALVRPGTGLVALGTLTFSAASQADSVLIVPQYLIGWDEDGAWLTRSSHERDTLISHAEAVDHLAACASRPGADTTAHRPTPAVTESGPEGDSAGGSGAGAGTPGTTGPSVTAGQLATPEYLAALERVRQRMHAGEASKVVIARDLMVTPPAPVPTASVLARLTAAYPTCWTFAVDGMVGASPELLVRLYQRRLYSRVLAGTARRTGGPDDDARSAQAAALAQWLAGSDKNRREHALARQSALGALEPLCSALQATEPFVLTLPNVLHLATDISGVIAGDTGALSLVGALHPTAAVGGTPTPEALAIIADEEGMDRERYAGPVGWVDWHGEGEWCIALRSGQIDPRSCGAPGPQRPVRVFGGGGIMPDSDPADELAETRAKMRPMLHALGADLPE